MPDTTTCSDYLKKAVASFNEAKLLRDRAVSRTSNETPAQAWAAVCRACAVASDMYHRSRAGSVHGRSDHVFFNNIDVIWWHAKAQVETLARGAL